jgi:hypothetical protein
MIFQLVRQSLTLCELRRFVAVVTTDTIINPVPTPTPYLLNIPFNSILPILDLPRSLFNFQHLVQVNAFLNLQRGCVHHVCVLRQGHRLQVN